MRNEFSIVFFKYLLYVWYFVRNLKYKNEKYIVFVVRNKDNSNIDFFCLGSIMII